VPEVEGWRRLGFSPADPAAIAVALSALVTTRRAQPSKRGSPPP